MAAFERAIQVVVRPGDVVLDLGAGTGILGLLACRAGAGRVYSVDRGAIIGLARELCKENGYAGRICHVKGLSTRLELPEPVDVVVADQIGSFGIDAGVVQYFRDAAQRLLKAGGRFIPQRIDLLIAPIESAELRAHVDFWKQPASGFGFSPAARLATNLMYTADLLPNQMLSDPVMALSLVPGQQGEDTFTVEACALAARDGKLHGIGGWFSAQLSENVTLTNSPLCAYRINRRNVFLPASKPVPVQQGDQVRMRITMTPVRDMVCWDIEVLGGGGHQGAARKARSKHSSFNGMLLCEEDVRKARPNCAPELSAQGEVSRYTLELCDGKRTLREIEEEVYGRYAEFFRSPSEVAELVSQIILRYAQ